MTVPDGVEPIIAWRSWTLVTPETLYSIARCVEWPKRAAHKADCRIHDGYSTTLTYTLRGFTTTTGPIPHQYGPVEGCSCGYWALKAMPDYTHPVVGTVKMWGKIIEGSKGYRSEYAYPDRLYLIDDPSWAHEPLWHRQGRARLLGEAYGVECTLISRADYLRLRDLDRVGKEPEPDEQPAEQQMAEEVAQNPNDWLLHTDVNRRWRIALYACIALNLAAMAANLTLAAIS